MKVTVNDKSKEKPCYPYLGINKIGLIVLFHYENSGTVLFRGNSGENTGRYSSSWEESKFEFFPGEIVLSNS